MIKDKEALFQYAAAVFWRVGIHDGYRQTLTRPTEKNVRAGSEWAWKQITELHHLLREEVEAEMRARSDRDPMTVSKDFYNRISTWLENLAADLERRKQQHLLLDLYAAASYWESFAPQSSDWVGIFITCLRLLLGDEKRLLAGLRNGRAAYRAIQAPLTSNLAISQAAECLITMGDFSLKVLDQDDMHMIPDPSQLSKRAAREKWPEVRSTQAISDLLSDAYYNQYYVPHPAGAYVKLHSGDSLIRGLTIKVKPSVSDRNYHDFIFRFHLEDGDFFLGMDALMATRQALTFSEVAGRPLDWGYLYLLGAQVYHDLVTVRHLPQRRRGEPEKSTPVERKSLVRDDEPAYRYIPRVVQIGRENSHPARCSLDTPRVSDPHYVSGHPRIGNLTDDQRQRILEFEAETGFKVLDNLPEGKTWVRPHMSPKADGTVVQNLPRFIRARIQTELTRRLRGE